MESFADPESLIDRIYEAAVAPDLWPGVLDDVARCGGAVGGGLFVKREDDWLGWRVSDVFGDPSEYFATSAAQSSSTAKLLGMQHPGFVPDQAAFTEEEYRNDVMISRWALGRGLYRGAATAVHVPNGDVAVFQVMRPTGKPAFEQASIARLDALRPHLARAAMLASRWRLERMQTVVQALDLLGFPAAVVGATGHPSAANASFTALTEEVVWLAGGRVRFVSANATSALQAYLARLPTAYPPVACSFALNASDGAQPAVVHLAPVRGEARDLFGGGMALLVIMPLGLRRAVDLDLVQSLFDLTPAEAQVAAKLLSGRSPAEIASDHRVGVETVRAQVKSVLAKSGFHRQSEFVAKFAPATALARPPHREG